MKFEYSFSVLRYVHDPTSQEFVNIGVAVFSAQAQFLRAICTQKYGRVANLFHEIDGPRFRQILRYLQEQICRGGESQKFALPFEPHVGIEHILAKVLPPDDSAFQFSRAGVGLSSNLDRTLSELFERHVERYTFAVEARRTREDVWRVFKEPLDRVHVTHRLNPKTIVAPSYEYDFERSWKNEIWHVYEPVSFDMVEASSILEKANRWLGRVTSLMDSPESFKIHMLLGEPTENSLKEAYSKAQNILNKIPGKKEFVHESEAEAFAEELARDIANHRA